MDLPSSDRPSTSTKDEKIDKIMRQVLENRCMSLSELSQETDLSVELVHNILTGIFGMKRIATKMVPKEKKKISKRASKADHERNDFSNFNGLHRHETYHHWRINVT